MAERAHRGRLVVGTSGFAYRHWRGSFYPSDLSPSRWLESYAQQFGAVEMNVTFYRLPERRVFEGWAARTPPGFEFAVKGSRLITHYHRLRDVDEALESLLQAAEGLGPKLAIMLWQLPPRTPVDLGSLTAFCDRLPRERAATGRIRHAFEFRDARWFTQDVLDVLAARGHALVIADPPPSGQKDVLTADFTYRRFHHGDQPDGGYADEELDRFAAEAARSIAAGRDVYAFFNNDPFACAPRNALRYVELAGRKR